MESEFDKIQQEILETEQSYKVSKRLIELAQKDLDEILSRLNQKDDRKIDGIEIKLLERERNGDNRRLDNWSS
mgnify:CR=1 FL=1